MSLPEAISQQTLRIIDANLNRIGEGLRFLEEIARLLLNDAGLTQQLKTMRHEMLRSDWPFQQQLLQARNSAGDVGIDIKALGEERQRELTATLMANARRVQESLRVMEELAKIPSISLKLDSEKFKQARFNLYTIEQALLSKLLRRDKIKRLTGLYVILDTPALKGYSQVEVATKIVQGGARTIQLRNKLRSKSEQLPIARQLKNLCAEQNVLFIVTDHLDLALAADADGLHLEQNDLPIKIARRLLPMDKILGCSTTAADQAIAAQNEGADYITAGPIYPTAPQEMAIGLETLRQIRQSVSLPLVAFGGINNDNTAEVIAAGAESVAVIGATLETENTEEASRQIADKLEIPK